MGNGVSAKNAGPGREDASGRKSNTSTGGNADNDAHNRRGSVTKGGSIASTGLDAAELITEDLDEIMEILPVLKETDFRQTIQEKYKANMSSARWSIPTVTMLKLLEAATFKEMDKKETGVLHQRDLESFFERCGHHASVGTQFFLALDLTKTNSLSQAELHRLDWRAFLKDQSVIQAKPPSEADRAAKKAYEVSNQALLGYLKFWRSGKQYLHHRVEEMENPAEFDGILSDQDLAQWSDLFMPHMSGWLRYFLVVGNVLPLVRDTSWAACSTVATLEESISYVMGHGQQNMDLIAATIGIMPPLLFGPFTSLLEQTNPNSKGKKLPFDRQQYFKYVGCGVITVVVGILLEYKKNIVQHNSKLLDDWAMHALKALLGTKPVPFQNWHVKTMQDVAEEGLRVLADDGERTIFAQQNLGTCLGSLGHEITQDTHIRLDDKEILGPVAHIFEAPAEVTSQHQGMTMEAMNELYALLVVQYLNVAADKVFQPIAAEISATSSGEHSAAAPKGFSRMHVKVNGDYKDEPEPRACANLDGVRCGIVFNNADTFTEGYNALRNHSQLQLRRVKNNFDPDFDARKKTFGYRCILCNAIVTHAQKTWLQVFREAEKELDDVAQRLAGVYGDRFAVDALAVLSRLRQDEKFLKQPFCYLAEVQLLLDDYMDMRRKSHLLYKIVRADCSDSWGPLQEDFSKEAVLWSFDV